MTSNSSTIQLLLKESIDSKTAALNDIDFIDSISKTAEAIKKCISSKGTIFVCGNGGSACDAMHFVEELVARYKKDRIGIKALHFMDGATLTCWSNDVGYESAFQRQAETFCSNNDVLIGISTSGNSNNIFLALQAAKSKGATTIGLLGKGGGKITEICDINITVPSVVTATERIQEIHITAIHILCELVETWILDK
jgi:D-sedoheptulose 7-phosphate isomerase